MKIAGLWLERAETQAVCAMLARGGHQALLVGGCVRNALLGVQVGDIDIASDALPERVIGLAEAAGLRAVPTGILHGTVTVVAGGLPHEVTTFRRDVQTDGRHAVVAFTDQVAEDASRRDFTMNALYATAQGDVVDPLGGLGDVLAHRVRFVGDPAARIAEDYLRILRFFRFQAWYGDPALGVDAAGLAACAEMADGIAHLSRERVGAEMRKLLGAPDPSVSLAAMAAAGILARVLPGSSARAMPVLVHLEQDLAVRWLRRLAVLGGQEAEDRLRLTRVEARNLSDIQDAIGAPGGSAVLAYRHGADVAADILLVRAALLGTDLPTNWKADLDRGAGAVLPVGPEDFMPALQGAALGARLRAAEAQWFASDLTATRSELLR